MTVSGARASQIHCSVSIRNKQGREVSATSGCAGTISMENVTLWWPYTHSSTPGGSSVACRKFCFDILVSSLIFAKRYPLAGEHFCLAGTTNEDERGFLGKSILPGYQYTLVVSLSNATGEVVDVYPVKFGIRTVEASGNQFMLNGKPFYFTGFGNFLIQERNLTTSSL